MKLSKYFNYSLKFVSRTLKYSTVYAVAQLHRYTLVVCLLNNFFTSKCFLFKGHSLDQIVLWVSDPHLHAFLFTVLDVKFEF